MFGAPGWEMLLPKPMECTPYNIGGQGSALSKLTLMLIHSPHGLQSSQEAFGMKADMRKQAAGGAGMGLMPNCFGPVAAKAMPCKCPPALSLS